MNSHVHPLFSSALNSFAKAQQEPAKPEFTHIWRELQLARIPRTMKYRTDGIVERRCTVLSRDTCLNGANQPVEWCVVKCDDGRTVRCPAAEVAEIPARPATLAEKDAALKRAQDLISEAIGHIHGLSAGTREQRTRDLISDLRSGLDQIEEAL